MKLLNEESSVPVRLRVWFRNRRSYARKSNSVTTGEEAEEVNNALFISKIIRARTLRATTNHHEYCFDAQNRSSRFACIIGNMETLAKGITC